MNSRERFLKTVQGEPADRRPFGAILSLYGAKLTGCPLERHCTDAAAFARGQDAVRQTLAPDFLTSPFMFAVYGEAFGSTIHYPKNNVPNILRPAISSACDISAVTIPDLDTHPRLLFIRDTIRIMSAEHGNDAVIIGIVLSPLDLPIMIMGLEAWLLTILTDEDGTRRMLDITIPFFVRLCDALLSDGADILAMPMAFLARDITTPHIVSEFALPVLRKALAQISGPVLFHHTGSSFFEYLRLLDPLPGVTGFTMDIRDPLPEARRCIRSETLLAAGFDGPSLYTQTPADITGRCLELLTVMKDDPRYIPFATGVDVDLRTQADQLFAIKQAVEDFQKG